MGSGSNLAIGVGDYRKYIVPQSTPEIVQAKDEAEFPLLSRRSFQGTTKPRILQNQHFLAPMVSTF